MECSCGRPCARMWEDGEWFYGETCTECGYLCPGCCRVIMSEETVNKLDARLKSMNMESMSGFCLECLTDDDGEFMSNLNEDTRRFAHAKKWVSKLKNCPRIHGVEHMLQSYVSTAYDGTEKERIAELGRMVKALDSYMTRPNSIIARNMMRYLRQNGIGNGRDVGMINFLVQRITTVPIGK